jgi:hypothetical protein
LAYSILGPAERVAPRDCGDGEEEEEDGARLEEEEEEGDSSDDGADEAEAEAEAEVLAEKAALGRMEATPLRIPVRPGRIRLADMLRLIPGE